MEKLFYLESIAIIGLSPRPNNIPRLVLENLTRWGYMGRIFGINPRSSDRHVDGIKMYKDVGELPVVPDLVFILILHVLRPMPSIHNVQSDKGRACGLWPMCFLNYWIKGEGILLAALRRFYLNLIIIFL